LNVRDFTSSWRDGLAFNALIHSIRPDLVDLRLIERMEPRERLKFAFKIAEEQLGVPSLIDAEGMSLSFFSGIFKIIEAKLCIKEEVHL